MIAEETIAATASLLGDPTRAAFVVALSEADAQPASELAQRAGVTASTASIQLRKLVDGGLLRVERHGRHRYYALADPAIAAVLESLAAIAPARHAPARRPARAGSELQAARTCYDHLAGVLGVRLYEALTAQGILGAELEPTESGARRLAALGIDVSEVRRSRRPFGRTCLDWTERRHHLAGALGAALAARFFELGWIERTGSTRAVRLTPKGRRALVREFGLSAR